MDLGPSGSNGVDGARGLQGPAGNDGADGATGVAGPAGADGQDGADGAQGTQGEQGPKGDTGLTGAKGDTGALGTNGTNGIDGINGTNGTNGIDGVNGLDGTDRATGADGAAGADGVGDIRVVSVTLSPTGTNGTFGPLTDYTTSSACTTSDMPIDAGLLMNTNTATRITASVTKIDPFNQATEFQVVQDDTNIQTGDIINQPVVFFVKCATPSSVVTATSTTQPPSVVFVSREKFKGSGPASGDNACNAEAQAAGLTGTFKAWISTTTSFPSTEVGMQSANGYERTDGQVVATNFADLTDGQINMQITKYADGRNSQQLNENVWTGTRSNGNVAPTGDLCDNWTTSDANSRGVVRLTGTRDGNWSLVGVRACSNSYAVYCFQQQ